MFGYRTFGFRHSTVNTYSQRLKSERSDFGVLENRSVAKQFGFQMFGLYYIYKPNVRFSDVLTKLDHFIKKDFFMTPLYIKRSSLALKMNRTNGKQTERPKSERLKLEHFFVRFVKPNVRFSALYCIGCVTQ